LAVLFLILEYGYKGSVTNLPNAFWGDLLNEFCSKQVQIRNKEVGELSASILARIDAIFTLKNRLGYKGLSLSKLLSPQKFLRAGSWFFLLEKHHSAIRALAVSKAVYSLTSQNIFAELIILLGYKGSNLD
jgi:hypothetical protein